MEVWRKKVFKRRYMMMGLVIVGGGFVIGFFVGVLVLVIGVGFVVGFLIIGIGGISVFLGGVGGVVIIIIIVVMLGGIVGVRVVNCWMGVVKIF